MTLSPRHWGIRLRCANCHDHPLDRWTQDDYHGLAAIFATIDRGESIRSKPAGKTIHPATGEAAVRRILLSDTDMTAEDPRSKLAQWISDRNNSLFPRYIVNQVWKHLLGRGLIEPAEDIRVTNPATHPELLEELTEQFVTSGFRLKPLVRSICMSSAWSRRGLTNSGSHPGAVFLAHRVPRPLSPEVLLDCIGDVTGFPHDSAGSLNSIRLISVSRLSSPVVALEALGRCPDKGPCAGSEQNFDSQPLALHLINGDLLNQGLNPESRLQKSLKDVLGDDLSLIDDLYLRVLSRLPTADERRVWSSEMETNRQSGELTDTIIDLSWALMTSDEFLTSP